MQSAVPIHITVTEVLRPIKHTRTHTSYARTHAHKKGWDGKKRTSLALQGIRREVEEKKNKEKASTIYIWSVFISVSIHSGPPEGEDVFLFCLVFLKKD